MQAAGSGGGAIAGAGGGGGSNGPRSGPRGPARRRAGEHELEEHGADTVLYYARAGDLDGVRRMVGADVSQANYQRIVTPLMWAAYCGHAKVVRFLLDCGAHIDQTEEGKGRTALYLASGRGHAEVVKLLLSRGANPTIKRKGGWCPLSVAASEAHVNVVRILLAHRKVDVDSRDNDGSTALYRASLWGCTEAVRELLRKGADPTIPGGGGLTPVAVAKARGYRGCIEALEDAERVYELAKARKLLRIRSLLERLSLMDPAHLSTNHWYQDIPPYLRARLEGTLDLPLPIITFSEDEHTTLCSPAPETTAPTPTAAAAQPTAPAAAVAAPAAPAAATTSGASLWSLWLRGGGNAGSGGGRGTTSTSTSTSRSTVFAAAAAFSASGAAGQARREAPAAPEATHTPPRRRPHAGLTSAELAPAVAARAVQELSFDQYLTLAEMLV